jgi:hypothetical protein
MEVADGIRLSQKSRKKTQRPSWGGVYGERCVGREGKVARPCLWAPKKPKIQTFGRKGSL